MLKIFAENIGGLTLLPRQLLATGGEGDIYLVGKKVFKIYHNKLPAADKLIALMQVDKVFKGFVAPQGLVWSEDRAKLLGYWMHKVEGVPLVSMFATPWIIANKFSLQKTIDLVKSMQEAVSSAHGLNALLVDCNEFNWMAQDTQAFVLDVDSWQLPNYPAQVIMPSIRDWHTQVFTRNSDWFSWGVVSFQLFTGIHPFKGTHPKFKKNDLEGRMKAHASVFDKLIKLNSAVRDFSCIPADLKDWYFAVFQQGQRLPPPAQFSLAVSPGAGTPKRVRQITGQQGKLSLNLLDDSMVWLRACGDNWFETSKGFVKGLKGIVLPSEAQTIWQDCKVEQTSVAISLTHLISGKKWTVSLQNSGVVVLQNRLFAKVLDSDLGLVELQFSNLGTNTLLTVAQQWPVLVAGTQFFKTMGIMAALQGIYLLVPDVSNQISQILVKELQNYVILDAHAGSNKAWVLGANKQDGKTYRLRFSLDQTSARLLETELTDETWLNMITTPKGLTIHIPADSQLMVFSKSAETQLTAQFLEIGFPLIYADDKICQVQHGKLFQISLSS